MANLGPKTAATVDKAYSLLVEMARLIAVHNRTEAEDARYHLYCSYTRISRQFEVLPQDIQTAAFVLHRLKG